MRRSRPGRRRVTSCHASIRLRLAILLLALSATGCGLQPEMPSAQRSDATQLGLGLAQRDKQINSLQTSAIMEYTGGGEHVKVRERIVAERPASVRVDVMSAVGVALVVAADGGQVAIFNPSKNTLMQGPATAAVLDRYARIPMAPQDAVRMLMSLTPDSAMLAFAPNQYGTTDVNTHYLLYREPNGVTDYLTFDVNNNLVSLRQTLASGRESYEVHYSDYRASGPGSMIMFPYQVAASFPGTGASVKFRYEQPILDGDINDSTFTLSPGEDTRRITLGMADTSRLCFD
jgi:outer membrane lipoprotein-sorting protein